MDVKRKANQVNHYHLNMIGQQGYEYKLMIWYAPEAQQVMFFWLTEVSYIWQLKQRANLLKKIAIRIITNMMQTMTAIAKPTTIPKGFSAG